MTHEQRDFLIMCAEWERTYEDIVGLPVTYACPEEER